MAKLYEAFRRISAGGSSLDQLVSVILKAIRNLINSEHNMLLFVDHARNQLWTKWTLGTVMDNKVWPRDALFAASLERNKEKIELQRCQAYSGFPW